MPITSRWTTLAASIYLQFICGVSSSFAILAPAFVKKLNYRQLRLTIVSFCLDLGASVGILGAFICYAIMKSQTNNDVDGGCIKVGAYIVYVIVAVLCFVGYFVAWFFLTNVLKSHQKIAMHMVMLLA
ncbi:hypothetical protein CTI12_AA590560 [Artemisia annua]|uniref:Nodulin-like domain-containing protein n=1 Tax=Artemisia annua TaxID=35608 RepID=A0A2U1KLH0_ARTAN|nr:hypothetical protein CTI12_AA590560 [Artemisia annua]